jgi:acetylornithine deacetylase/succinyl-diaminopimelate desuccinylase-like protein
VHTLRKPNVNNQGKFRTFADLMQEHCNNEQEDEYLQIATEVSFDADAMKKIFQVLRDKGTSAPPIASTLSHNDFGAKHIMCLQKTLMRFCAGYDSITDWKFCGGFTVKSILRL